MRRTVSVVFSTFVLLAALASRGATPTPVMILDGESAGPYHKWQLVTPVLKKQLDETGLFQVDVVTALPSSADSGGFKPEFSTYRVVVLNYDAPSERWSGEVKAAFERYVESGGGLVIVHGADNAFPDWQAFNKMIPRTTERAATSHSSWCSATATDAFFIPRSGTTSMP